jgi:hypothetical protein
VMNGGSKEEATIAMVVRRRCDARWQHPRVEVEKGKIPIEDAVKIEADTYAFFFFSFSSISR